MQHLVKERAIHCVGIHYDLELMELPVELLDHRLEPQLTPHHGFRVAGDTLHASHISGIVAKLLDRAAPSL